MTYKGAKLDSTEVVSLQQHKLHQVRAQCRKAGIQDNQSRHVEQHRLWRAFATDR
jgi:hypothetical protein